MRSDNSGNAQGASQNQAAYYQSFSGNTPAALNQGFRSAGGHSWIYNFYHQKILPAMDDVLFMTWRSMEAQGKKNPFQHLAETVKSLFERVTGRSGSPVVAEMEDAAKAAATHLIA